MSKTCSFEGCEKPIKSKGLCDGHYYQQRQGQELRPLRKKISKAEAERLRAQGLKKCYDCDQVKLIEDFAKDKSTKDGRQRQCKECQAEYKHQYYEANRERILEYARQYYEANRERRQEYGREYSRQWAKENPEKRHANNALRRARKRGATVGEINWDTLRDVWGENPKCVWCRTAPFEHWDHIIPLAGGGQHVTWNLAPACASCNSSKNAKDVVDWYLPRVGLGDYV